MKTTDDRKLRQEKELLLQRLRRISGDAKEILEKLYDLDMDLINIDPETMLHLSSHGSADNMIASLLLFYLEETNLILVGYGQRRLDISRVLNLHTSPLDDAKTIREAIDVLHKLLVELNRVISTKV